MKIVAAISRRYEPDWLVDELLENLSWLDDVLIYDDRGRDPDGLTLIEIFYGSKIKFIVGDSLADVQAARTFGCPVAIVYNPKLDFTPEGADSYLEELFPYEQYDTNI